MSIIGDFLEIGNETSKSTMEVTSAVGDSFRELAQQVKRYIEEGKPAELEKPQPENRYEKMHDAEEQARLERRAFAEKQLAENMARRETERIHDHER